MRLLWQKTPDSTSPLHAIDATDSSPDTLVAVMVANHRSALLLRPQLAEDLELSALRSAVDHFRRDVSLVSAGCVRLDRWQVDAEAISEASDSSDCVDVDSVFLERCAITNEQFQGFVDEGGYLKQSLWHASVWPRVKEFVDRTGSLGPQFWSNGRHAATEADHPVVGVSWFEAEAYSRWIGMRLPTDAEWVRAACSPIETNGTLAQRKYPWGNSFSSERANLWGVGEGSTAPADAYFEGDSAGGARQMIGNVWEWTASNLQLWCGRAPIELVEQMKSLRGGAFDSYLDTLTTCQCHSGDTPLARRHNIGFRCAVSACDVVELASQVGDGTTI